MGSRLLITVFCAFLFLLLFPVFICGCHFHAIAVIPNLPPVVWGLYAVFSYRTRGEQVVGWLAFFVGLGCLWIGFDANHKFAFMAGGFAT